MRPASIKITIKRRSQITIISININFYYRCFIDNYHYRLYINSKNYIIVFLSIFSTHRNLVGGFFSSLYTDILPIKGIIILLTCRTFIVVYRYIDILISPRIIIVFLLQDVIDTEILHRLIIVQYRLFIV